MRRGLKSFLLTLTGLVSLVSALLIHARSNTPAETVNRTQKTTTADSQSCGACHTTKDTNFVATFTAASGSPPNQLYPGDYGNYRIRFTKTGDTTTTMNLAVDVAASDTVSALTETSDWTTTALAAGVPEVTNNSGTDATLRPKLNMAINYFSFRYTMPATAQAGSTHTLHGVGGHSSGWNYATPFNITTKALPAPPTSITPSSPTSSTINLSWSGGGPQYLILRKEGSDPSSPTDPQATTVYTGSGTSTTATGLNGSTTYYFAAFSRDLGVHSGAAFHSSTAATNNLATTPTLDPNPYVDVVGGSDDNTGSSASPFRTIKKALTAVGANGTISVRPGTYNVGSGEIFPITIPSGVKLKSTAGAASTIIDASAANPRKRVIYCSANSNTTLLEGFTITGGLDAPANTGVQVNAQGGGIFTENDDQTTISRCIITGNTARGQDGNATYKNSSYAYGGGAYLNGRTKVVNCVFSNNIARSGDPFDGTGLATDAHGGAISGFSNVIGHPKIINSTFNANQALGGVRGSAFYTIEVQNGTVVNNIVTNNVTAAGAGGANAFRVVVANNGSNNLFSNNSGTGGSETFGTNAITADPIYVNAPSDLHLRSASPARAAGAATADVPTVDLEGNPRTTPTTIGAYEIGLFLTAIGGIGRITVSWPGVSGGSSHNLYMSQSAGVTTGSTKITGATSPYVLEGQPNNATWYFRLAAVENGVEGPLSPEVSATTSNGTWVKAIGSGTSFYNLTRDLASGTTLYAVAGDSAGVYRSTNSGDTWTALTGPVTDGTLRAVAANGSNVLVAGAGKIFRSTNGGSDWTTSVTGAGIGEDYIASIAIDPLAPNIVYAGNFHINGGSTSSDLIAKSVDSGATFFNIIDGSATNIRAYYLAIDPATSGTLYAAGSGSPNIARSTNNGAQWTSVSPVAGYPTSLTLAPSATQTLFAGMRNISNSESLGVYKSTNGGTNWNLVNTGLPSSPIPNVGALLVDSTTANRVHAGTEAGYYFSTNGATNWTAGPAGGTYPSSALSFSKFAETSTRRLVGMTFAGIYLLPLDGSPSIINVTPLYGSTTGGDTATVTGSGFVITSGLRVLFGGADATVNLGNSTSGAIAVTTPAHAAGTVDVAVINPDGQAAVRTSAFTYNVCTFQLSPTSASYTSAAASASVGVTAPQGCNWTATVPGGSFVTITGGSSGSGNGTVSYSVAQNTTGAVRTTTLTIAGLSFEVSQSASGAAVFALTATASPSNVALVWSSAGAGVTYEVRRSQAGGAFGAPLTTTTGLNYTDTNVTHAVGYLYRVDAIGVGPSNVDLAVPFVYTNPTIAAQSSLVKAVDFTELRQAVNAARSTIGQGPANFTGTIAAGVPVQRIHLVELRSNLDAVHSALGRPALTYTDTSVVAGTTIVKGAHVLELRAGVQ